MKVITAVTDACSRKNGTVNRSLLSLLSSKSSANATPFKGVATYDHTVDPDRKLWIRLFVPTVDDNRDLPVIVFFHGGGFVFLSADSKPYDVVCRRFARTTPAIVVSVNYRLAPEYRYPAQFEDGFDVLKFLDYDDEKNKDVLPSSADVSRCILAGDSAGGNLAHHVALRACGSTFKKLKVIGVVAIQPFFGGKERTEAEIKLDKIDPFISVKRTDFCWKAFMPEGEECDRDHEVINVSGPRAVDISKVEFPATLVVVAGFDSLKDWQMRYYEWLKGCGKDVELLKYPNMVHAFYAFPGLRESDDLIEKVGDFVRRQCSTVPQE